MLIVPIQSIVRPLLNKLKCRFAFHEATFAQTEQARAKETYHTTAAQAAQLALDANVRQLVIGHFSARYEDESVLLHEASAIFHKPF